MMENKSKKKDKKHLVLEDKIIAFFCILAVILTLLAIFVTVADIVNKNTNNNINAYAVEEEEILNIPFDLTLSRYRICSDSFTYSDGIISYENRGLTFSGSASYLTLENGKIYLTLYDDFSYNVYRYITPENVITINNYGTITNIGALNMSRIALATDIFVHTDDYYKINLTDFPLNSFVIVYYNSGYITPIMFFEKQNDALMNSMPDTILYDTTQTAILDTSTNKYNIKSVADYGEFKLSSISYDWGINGNFAQYPLQTTRIFTLNADNKYQEGFNNGYEEGYNNAMEEMQNANIQNPFKNRWQVNAYANRNNNTSVVMNNADYEDVYGYIDNCIYNNLPVGLWAYTINQTYNDIANYNLVFWANNVNEYFIDLSVNQILSIGQVAIVDDKATYTNEIRYDVSVKLSILNASNSQTQVITLNYLANDIINIDFTNINGADYTYGYLKGVELQFIDYSYLSNKYCIRFNNYGNGNYSQGYYQGYKDGSANANNGYMKGYNQGYADAQVRGQYTFFSLIGALIDAPIVYFSSLFDFEILGTNIKGFLLGLFTLAIIITLVRVSLGKK